MSGNGYAEEDEQFVTKKADVYMIPVSGSCVMPLSALQSSHTCARQKLLACNAYRVNEHP